jgi:hypothetical protein
MTRYRERREAGEYLPEKVEEAVTPAGAPRPGEAELDELSKDELLAYAQSIGVSPANAGMTKDELRAGIEDAWEEG